MVVVGDDDGDRGGVAGRSRACVRACHYFTTICLLGASARQALCWIDRRRELN